MVDNDHGQQNQMTREEHIKRHQLLHGMADELMADMIDHTGMLPSTTTVMDMMRWSKEQMINPEVK